MMAQRREPFRAHGEHPDLVELVSDGCQVMSRHVRFWSVFGSAVEWRRMSENVMVWTFFRPTGNATANKQLYRALAALCGRVWKIVPWHGSMRPAQRWSLFQPVQMPVFSASEKCLRHS